MKRISKRRKISSTPKDENMEAEEEKTSCCVCCTKLARSALLQLSTVITTVDGCSVTIAAVIEALASVEVHQVAQSICEGCWSEVQAAHMILKKIRQSKHLGIKNENGNQAALKTDDVDVSTACVKIETSTATSTITAEIGYNFEILTDELSNNRIGQLSEEEYECEYLDEYLEPGRSDDHTYDSRRDDEAKEEVIQGNSLSLFHDAVVNDSSNVTRQFQMPRTNFVKRNELHDRFRLLEVGGERCCGCSFVAENRRELLQHSETVHAKEITDSGDYCPICFFKFATDEQLERHIREFKSTTIYVCLQCNRFYNIRQKMFNHLLKCVEGNGEMSMDDTEGEEEAYEENDGEEYTESTEHVFDDSDPNSKVSTNITESYQRKMVQYRTLFDEMITNEVFSCELDETGLNVQESQIVAQCSFDTFKYVRLRGERCCGCSYTCTTREQLMQHGQTCHVSDGNATSAHTCSLCGAQFDDEREIVEHLSFFTSKELYFCTICNASFLNKESLRHHQGQNERHQEQLNKVQHDKLGTLPFVELDQDDVAEQLEKLQAEQITNRAKAIRVIPMPATRFIKSMTEHKNYCVLTVVGERCCGCGMFFDSPSDLKQHSTQEHTLPLGSNWLSDHLQCEICYGVFDFERGLALHRAMRRSNMTNLYLCKICGLLFTKKFSLARHMQLSPNHLSQLIVDASSGVRKAEPDGAKVDGREMLDLAKSDPRVAEALELHTSIKKAGLQKAGHFVGYHCCFSKCRHTFENDEELLEHSQEEHSGQRRENEVERKSDENVCPCCCKPFQNLAKLAWHRFQRFVPRQYNCKQCDKSFDKWAKLKLHVETKHNDDPPNFPCTYCDKSFILSSRLKGHLKIHTNKQFACDVCGDRFSSNGLMKRHKRSVHCTELLFECKLCPKRFAVIEKLQIHKRVHTGEKPFECSYCSRGFSHHTDRKRHEMAAHTGERPFKCLYCNASYIRNRELSLHMRKHTNLTSFEQTVEQQDSSEGIKN